jgi:hypothetical protein
MKLILAPNSLNNAIGDVEEMGNLVVCPIEAQYSVVALRFIWH